MLKRNIINISVVMGTVFIVVIILIINKSYAYQNYFDNILDISTLYNDDLNLPNKYDLRDVDGINYMTPVKNQESYGLCWAFSTTTSFESSLKRSGYVSTDFNKWFSPYQIDALLTPKVKIPDINYVSFQERDALKKLGEGANVDLGYRALTTAYSPVLYENFNKEKYEEHYNNILTNKFKLNDIYNEKNSDYYVTDYDILEKINDIPLENVVKYYVYNYGAVIVGTILPLELFNDITKEVYIDTSSVDTTKLDFKESYAEHAMAIIGWDDSKNSWILQNSWGDNFSYLYMTYDSYGVYAGIKKIAKKDWNNRYYGKNSSTDDYKALYEFEKIPSNDEIIHSIVGDFDQIGKYNLYISNDGKDESYQLIKTVDVKMRGRHTINLENKNIILNNNKFKFKVTYEDDESYNSSFVNYYFSDLYVFTNDINTSTAKNIYLYDLYDLTSKNQTLSIKFKGLNVSDISEIEIKIKNEINEDITDNFILNDSYYSNNYGEFNYRPNINQFPDERTEYTVQILLNNNVVSSKKFGVSNIDDIFKSGNGTKEDPFVITTAKQLQIISSSKEFYKFSYKLGCDIDMKELSFTSIGSSTDPFTGNFDGNNYTIYNLSKGIFGNINNASIKNIKLDNPKIEIKETLLNNVGFIAENIENSEIKNIYVENGIIDIDIDVDRMYIGMIIGNAKNSVFSDIYSSGNINIKNLRYNNSVGGIIGNILNDANNIEAYIMNSEFSGQINYNVSRFENYVGGIIGEKRGPNFQSQNLLFSGQINNLCQNDENCYNLNSGYFIGWSNYNKIKNSIYYQQQDDNIKIIGNSYFKVENYENIYAIVDNDDNENNYYVNKNSGAFLNEKTYNLDFNNIWYMSVYGPKIRSLTVDLTNKEDSIGETNTYDINYDTQIISNIKTNNGTITRKEFIDGFIVLLGEIYSSDGQLITLDDQRIKTGMIVRKNNKDYTIVIKGDVNNDGRVNSSDIILLRRNLVGNINFDNYQSIAGDVNDDGKINTTDIIHMRRAIAGGYDNSCQILWRSCE